MLVCLKENCDPADFKLLSLTESFKNFNLKLKIIIELSQYLPFKINWLRLVSKYFIVFNLN